MKNPTLKGAILGLAIALIAIFILKDCTTQGVPACVKSDHHNFEVVLKGEDCTYFECSGCHVTKAICIK